MKQYCIFEKESNGKFARQSVHPTRKEATDVLSKIFSDYPNADPQDFKIEEETITVQTEFEKLLDRLRERLANFSSNFMLRAQTMTSVVLFMDDGIDIWTSTEIRAIMEVLEDNATFSIALNPINDRLEMLIVDANT